MPFWRKFHSATPSSEFGGIAEATLAGASVDQLCEEVYSLLGAELSAGSVERFGVWIGSEPEAGKIGNAGGLQGRFWILGREEAEWGALGANFPVPWKRLQPGRAVLEELPATPAVSLGPTAEMRRALWMPARAGERLHGLLLAATRKTHGALPETAMARAAAGLALAVGFREATLSATAAAQDAAFAKKVWTDALNHTPVDTLLQQIVNRAARSFLAGEASASFVTAGILRDRGLPKVPHDAPMEFRWSSADSLWAQSPNSEPVASIWREALVKARVSGQEVRTAGSPAKPVRVVAIPLLVGGEPAGVMVAWLNEASATLATLERLELHGRLASLVLSLLWRSESGAAAELAQFFLEHTQESAFLLNDRLEITGASESGKTLLTLKPKAAREEDQARRAVSYGTSAQLFRPAEWRRMAAWMRDVSRQGAPRDSRSIETELRTGHHVRLLAASLPKGKLSLLVQHPDRAEAAPSLVSNELQSIIEWLDQGIVVFDEHGSVRAVNLRFSQLFGLSAAELKGALTLRDLMELLAPRVANSAEFAESWWKAAQENSGHQEIQVLRAAPRLLERFSRPVFDASGVRTGRLEIYRDLTTQQLFQAKLRKNQRLVSLGEKVGGIVHELSNPLATILGFAQRLLARSDTPFYRDEIRSIASEAERAAGILRQLLGSARDEAPEFQPVHVNALVQRTADLQRFQLASEKIRIELDLAQDLPPILGDAGQLQQVLMNLISNSRQALNGRQGGTISVRTRVSDSGRVLLEVADDGPGIPEGMRHRVFDPFFTTKPTGLGTGLGLSIVAGLMRQHNGHIRIVNSNLPGATFLMDFPGAPAEKLRFAQDKPAISASLPQRRSGERALVVEDEPTVAQLVADLLSDLGYSADVNHDAKRALVAALSRDYDLVVCDMKMPRLDGPHFYRALAEAGSPVVTKFLFVTGDVLSAATQEFLSQNGLAHVAKPFRLEEFAEKISQVSGTPGLARAKLHEIGRKNLANTRG